MAKPQINHQTESSQSGTNKCSSLKAVQKLNIACKYSCFNFRNTSVTQWHNVDASTEIETTQTQLYVKVRLKKTTKWICKDRKCQHYRMSECRRCYLRRNRPTTKLNSKQNTEIKQITSAKEEQIIQHSKTSLTFPKYFLRQVPLEDQSEISIYLKKKNFKLKFPKQSKGIQFIPEDQKLFDSNQILQNIVQGKIGDCASISVIASVINFNAKILQELFIVDQNPANYIGLYLYINGIQTLIHMDGSIPLVDRCTVSSSTQTNSLWLIYLEKALAYVYGGYGQLCEGNCAQFFTLLTGAPVNCFDPDQAKTESQKDELFNEVMNAINQNKMITLATKKDKQTALPYEQNHAYTLIGHQNEHFKILNPWTTSSVQQFSSQTLFKSIDLIFICEYEKGAQRRIYLCQKGLEIRLKGHYILSVLGTHFCMNKKPKRTLDPCFRIPQLEIQWSSHVNIIVDDGFYEFDFLNCKGLSLLVYKISK